MPILLSRQRRKKLLFAASAVLIFFAFSTAVLFVLDSMSVIDPERIDNIASFPPEGWLIQRNHDGQPYLFIEHMSMAPESFPKGKPAGEIRIALTGGSFALGMPYISTDPNLDYKGSITDWLRGDLSLRYPGSKIRVINASAAGHASHGLIPIVQKLPQMSVDALVLATGNNEGYVPFGKVNRRLNRWILYRFLKKNLLPDIDKNERPYFFPQDPDTIKIQKHFESNIREIHSLCKAAGIKLILCPMPINVKFSGPDPQVHGKSDSDITDSWLQAGKEETEKGQCGQGKKLLQKSRNVGMSALYYAQCLEKKKRFEQARWYYNTYVQYLPLNRTRPSFNEFLREYAKDQSLTMADLEDAAKSVSENQITDSALFMDYCHMTLEGYYIMARRISKTLSKSVLQGEKAISPKPLAPEEIVEKMKWRETSWGRMPENLLRWREGFLQKSIEQAP